jgi:uncharacterized protein (TIGR00251 family)
MGTDAATWWRAADGGITVSLRVQPGAKRNEVVDASGERLRVRIAAPAVDGKANAALERFVAELFTVRRSAVSLVRGERSREKEVLVRGIDRPPSDGPASLTPA